MRRFVLWGKRAGDVQIGSAEDRIVCARLNRQAAARVALRRVSAALTPIAEAMRAFREAFADANAKLVLDEARLLERDAALYGATFVDTRGRRIDPASVLKPTADGGWRA